jgi:hypothetical protein
MSILVGLYILLTNNVINSAPPSANYRHFNLLGKMLVSSATVPCSTVQKEREGFFLKKYNCNAQIYAFNYQV